MSTDRFELFSGRTGVTVIVGSADAKGLPAGCRGIAIRADPAALTTATVYVPVATSRDLVANAATTRRLAVAITNPLDHTSIQLKGTVTQVRLAEESEASFVQSGLDGFADSLAVIGVPRRLVRALNHWPAFALEMKVDEIFDQTPGPKAGTTLR